jgi:hypothetical protein
LGGYSQKVSDFRTFLILDYILKIGDFRFSDLDVQAVLGTDFGFKTTC